MQSWPQRTQIKYAGDKATSEEIIRLVAGLELDTRGLIDFESKARMFVNK
jgi:hypothetical protein